MGRPAVYVLSPLFYLGVALAGRSFTARGMGGWYQSLDLPSFTPPGAAIGAVWTAIYVLAAISLVVFWERARKAGGRALPVVVLYGVNGVVNALWSYVFFARHMLGLAVLCALLILLTVGVMMALAWPKSRAAALLLLPYLLWTAFASYLAYEVYRMNA